MLPYWENYRLDGGAFRLLVQLSAFNWFHKWYFNKKQNKNNQPNKKDQP